MRKRIFRNWGLKLISLMLAFMLWFVVVRIDDPQESKTFPNIPVKLKNTELLDAENKVYEVLEDTDTVRVTIRAPRSVTKDLLASDIVAEADVNKLTDINTIAISYNVSGAEIDSVRGDHDVVRLSVEERATRWIRVKYLTKGEPAENYMVAGVSLDQNIIEITGPKSAVEKVNNACVEVDVTGATSRIALSADPLLYDAEGNLLDSSRIDKNVNYIYMSVDVLATKEVPIEVASVGTPAEGYLATGVVESSVSAVKIAGINSVITGVSKIVIPAEEIDISGKTGDFAKTINIKDYLPENVRLADSDFNGRVTVTAYIEQEMEKILTLKETNFSITNVPAGYVAELVTEEAEVETEVKYELTVSGLEAAVAPVQAATVQGTVDVAAWLAEMEMEQPAERIYEIPVIFSLPEGVTTETEMYLKVNFVKTEEL